MEWKNTHYSRNIHHCFIIASAIGTKNVRYTVNGPQYRQTKIFCINVGADRRHQATAPLSGKQSITAQ